MPTNMFLNAWRTSQKRITDQVRQQRMYNQLHDLPENTTFEPSNGGTIEERSEPLYSNKLDRYTTETARGQELARMANTFKSATGLALTGLTGNWLWNGLRTAPLLTAAEFAGGAAGGSIGVKIGEILDKAGLENPILNAKETLGFLGAGTGIAAGKALKSADNYVTIQNALRTGKLRFGEPTTYTGIHQSKTPLTKVQFPYQRWDVTTHGADPNGFWLTLADSPNTTGTMANRPYASRWSATSKKPLIQTGEVKSLLGKKNNTRNAIVKYGRKHGADAFEFRGIADNKLPQTDVVMVTEGTNPQYLGEFTEHTYISPKTSVKSIQMEEPIMSSSKGLTEAERLGIPKGLRSDVRALEDPYYWGYEQWNQRYNDALNKGDYQEVQRIRDLHFKTKAQDTKVVDENGMPLHMYHGMADRGPKQFQQYEGVNWDVEHAVKNGDLRNHWKIAKPTPNVMANYHTPNYKTAINSYGHGKEYLVHDDYLNITKPFTYDRDDLHNLINSKFPGSSEKTLHIEHERYAWKPLKGSDGKYLRDPNGKIIWGEQLIPEKQYFEYTGVPDWSRFGWHGREILMQQGYDGLFIPQYYDSYGAFVSPSQFKAADPITWNGKGEIIPIVKRDNFHNLDRRYKQGGKIHIKKENR